MLKNTTVGVRFLKMNTGTNVANVLKINIFKVGDIFMKKTYIYQKQLAKKQEHICVLDKIFVLYLPLMTAILTHVHWFARADKSSPERISTSCCSN